MEVTKLQEDFLLDMLEYYCENPEERRNQNVYGNCMYAPQKDTSEGCAIGRKISKELQQKFDSRRESPVVNNVFNLLPENLQLLGCDFLTEVQQLHDGGYFWEEKDLSEDGRKRVTHIVGTHSLDYNRFSKYLTYGEQG